jgi:hypothetical protein
MLARLPTRSLTARSLPAALRPVLLRMPPPSAAAALHLSSRSETPAREPRTTPFAQLQGRRAFSTGVLRQAPNGGGPLGGMRMGPMGGGGMEKGEALKQFVRVALIPVCDRCRLDQS